MRLELALPLRHDPARNGRGVAVVAGRHREPWDTAGRKNARTHGIQCGTELKRQYPVIVVDQPEFSNVTNKKVTMIKLTFIECLCVLENLQRFMIFTHKNSD